MAALEWDDDLRDDEYPDESDWADDELQSDTVTCPFCSAEIYEDSERCPACGEYVTRDTNIRPLWRWTAAGILVLIACYLWYVLTRAP
jgi:predicted amidophosphoribosyltransferase